MSHDDIDYSELEEPEERLKLVDTGQPATEDTRNLLQEAPGSDVSDQLLREDANRADSWLHYHKGLGQTGFSPVEALTPDNVDTLSREYTVELSGAGSETNPLVVPGDPPVMYFTHPNYQVQAVNARTGETYWTFEAGLPSDLQELYSIGRNRGVAVRTDKVYLALPTVEILAIDRYTGEKQWRTNVHTERQRTEMTKPQRIGITQAPLAFDGRMYVGQTGDSGGWCAVSSLDADTGEVVWQETTVPESEWVGKTWQFASAAPWMSPSVDPDSGTVFWSVANPGPMKNGVVRPGPNQHSNSIMALDAASGDIKWINQLLPHEIWDYDVACKPIVHDLAVDGDTRRVVSHANKTGWIYTIDLETGQLLQRSMPFSKQDHSAFGRAFLSLLPAGEENMAPMWPAANGATEWTPNAYSPKTGRFYVGAQDTVRETAYNDRWMYDPENVTMLTGGFSQDPPGLGSEVKNTSHVAAVDASGEIAWKHDLADAPTDKTAFVMFTGGTTVTAGNVVLHGSSGGHLVALDAESGERRWRYDTGGGITAAPVVWTDPAADRAFVAIASDSTVHVFSSGE